MRAKKFYAVISVLSMALGGFIYTYVALSTNLLYTEADLKWHLAEQRVIDLANVCDSLGEFQWGEDQRNFQRLHGWGNTKLRLDYAAEMLGVMGVKEPLIERIRTECATRLSAA